MWSEDFDKDLMWDSLLECSLGSLAETSIRAMNLTQCTKRKVLGDPVADLVVSYYSSLLLDSSLLERFAGWEHLQEKEVLETTTWPLEKSGAD